MFENNFYPTAVKPGIYGLAFTMGKWFLTDNSATVGRILMIFLADPHEILILFLPKSASFFCGHLVLLAST